MHGVCDQVHSKVDVVEHVQVAEFNPVEIEDNTEAIDESSRHMLNLSLGEDLIRGNKSNDLDQELLEAADDGNDSDDSDSDSDSDSDNDNDNEGDVPGVNPGRSEHLLLEELKSRSVVITSSNLLVSITYRKNSLKILVSCL